MAAKNSENTQQGAASNAGAPVLFLSPHGALVVYHDGTKIATFEGGRFESDDAAIVAALRERADLCTEWVGDE